MKNIKPYLFIIYKLIIDLIMLSYHVIRQVILPNRRRKGNLLYSLFLLFIGLAERVIVFKHTLTTASWTYGKKYIRQGMIIATWGLFILSSFEWSGRAQALSLPVQNPQETTESIQLSSPKIPSTYASVSYSIDKRKISFTLPKTSIQHTLPSPYLTGRTWLRLCTLRI